MWWCCGKKEKDEPGCKFRQHQHKDDNDLDMDLGAQEEKKVNREQVRCYVILFIFIFFLQCCKQLGHSGIECLKDPNLKTVRNQATDRY